MLNESKNIVSFENKQFKYNITLDKIQSNSHRLLGGSTPLPITKWKVYKCIYYIFCDYYDKPPAILIPVYRTDKIIVPNENGNMH